MKKFFPILLLTLASSVSGQLEQYSTANVWETYSSVESNFSVTLPKMPTREGQADWCNSTETTSYYVYAEGVVYEVSLIAKVAEKVRLDGCGKSLRPFNESTLERRLNSLRGTSGESRAEVESRRVFKFENPDSMRWIISDIKQNDRWIELALFFNSAAGPHVDRFFESIRFNSIGGREIGEGADRTLGDFERPKSAPDLETEEVISPTATTQVSEDVEMPQPPFCPLIRFPLRIISKPKARRADPGSCAQGTVRLKVVLLANGGVGRIIPVTKMPDGLTEEVIKAARRIVFLPKLVQGVPVSVEQVFEYTFNIY